jgi:RNA polymerase sigma-70 factor (ECF subfamily)
MSQQLEEFIIKYQEDVLRYAYFLSRNEKISQDLAQECFLKALSVKKIPENAKAYLFQITKNIFIDQKRKQKTEASYQQDSLNQSNTSLEPADLSVWSTLFSLDPEEQEVLLLMDREGLSNNEASDLLKISEAALKSRLFRARENFKKNWKV